MYIYKNRLRRGVQLDRQQGGAHLDRQKSWAGSFLPTISGVKASNFGVGKRTENTKAERFLFIVDVLNVVLFLQFQGPFDLFGEG